MVYRTKKKYNSRKIKNKTKRNKTKRNKTKRKTVKLGGRPPSIFKPKNPTKPKIAWDNDKKKTKRKTVKLCGRPTSINNKNGGGDEQTVPADSLTSPKKSWLPSWEKIKKFGQHNGSQFKKKAAITANKLQLKYTDLASDNYRGRVFNIANKVGLYNTTHMDKYYDNTKITQVCDTTTPETCRCTSTERRVQDLLNMLENREICTNCGKQCLRTQKILENYTRLANNDPGLADLQSLPIMRFGRLLYNRSKFPAYYKGYMTPSRIETYIRYLLEQQPQIIQTDEKLTQMLNYPYPPMYRYDTNGYMISTCSDIYRGTKAPKIIENCNKIFKYINDLNKNLDEDPNNTKIYILFEHDKLHKLLLVDKDVFTKKYRSAIIDMEVPKEVTLANTYVGELLGADTVIGEGGITRDSWDSGRATIGSDIDRSSIYSDRSSMDSIDYDRSSQ